MIISCKIAARLQSEAEDHPLRPGKVVALNVHLALCSMCRKSKKQLEVLRKAFAYYREQEGSEQPPISHPMPPDVRERLHKTLKGE